MTETKRRCIIDIGSNTIRLVLFGGSARIPVVLYNEKVHASLGRGVFENGTIKDDALETSLKGLARFKLLVEAMQPSELHVVATAAARDASNGAAFLKQVQKLGFAPRLLTGEEEAEASGLGVISAVPDADGVVADLGGGSLELVRIAGGEVRERTSLPVGIFAIPGIRGTSVGKLRRHVQSLIADIPWAWRCDGLPLYLVGGSWRSLARAHIHFSGFPLSILSNYHIKPEEVRPLSDQLGHMDRSQLRAIPGLPSARVEMVADASALLAALTEAISPSDIVICSFGLREGLLYRQLDPAERAKDPLIESVRFATSTHNQFPGYAEAVFDWTAGLFAGDPPRLTRLRLAVSYMLGTGWASNPDFRALSGEELALQGNWVSIDASERATMGMALFVGLGGSGEPPAVLRQLASVFLLDRARAWGLAFRVAQRLSGGAPSTLRKSRILLERKTLIVSLPKDRQALFEETLSRRLQRLATTLGADDHKVSFF